jgi:hypothetical protein
VEARKGIRRQRGEEEGNPDTWARCVNNGRERQVARARELCQQRSLGSAQSGMRGKDEWAARREMVMGERWAAGLHWTKAEKRKIFLFFFFSQHFPKDFESSFEFE